MDADRFDALVAAIVAPSRRAAFQALTGLGIAGLVRQTEARKTKRRKKTCAKAGKKTSKKRKKCCKGLVKGAGKRCACRSGSCPANQICLLSGVCQPCTISCTGTPAECGEALQAALDGGGTIYVCPGNYRGGFILETAARVVGAGDGSDVASNTILDASDMGRVLTINSGVETVELERLLLTDGTAPQGGGILHGGTALRMTECTVRGNFSDGSGAGISVFGSLEMTRCTVRDNHAIGVLGQGGGILVGANTTLTDCLVADNRASVEGGGIWIGSTIPQTTTFLAGSTQVRDNAADFGGAILVGGNLGDRRDLPGDGKHGCSARQRRWHLFLPGHGDSAGHPRNDLSNRGQQLPRELRGCR
jgi:hypothetical protein